MSFNPYAAAYLQKMNQAIASPESLKAWAKKQNIATVDRDESGVAVELAAIEKGNIDPKEIGDRIVEALKLPQAIAREKETGRQSASLLPWDESDAGRDHAALKSFEKATDWEQVGSFTKERASNPSHPIPNNVDLPTKTAMEAIASLIDKDSTVAERLSGKWASPPTYAKVKIQEALRDLPQIRSLMESGEGLKKFAWNGEIYTAEERDGVLVLVKAAKPLYHQGKSRTDAKGRNMVFNEETRRWRIDRSESGKTSESGEAKSTEKKSRKPKAKPAEVGGMPVIEETSQVKPKGRKWKPKAEPSTEEKVQPKARKSKPKAEAAEAAPEKGGAIARIQGDLSTSSKQPEGKQPDKGLKGRAAIDDKYSSDEPTDDDVKGWINEAILEHTSPSNIHKQTLDEAMLNHGVSPKYLDRESKAFKQKSQIDTKEKWAEAVYAHDKKYVKERGEGGQHSWKNFSSYTTGLRASDGGERLLREAKRKVETARTEVSKQKAQKKLEQLEAHIKEERETSEATAQRFNKKINTPKKQRIAELHQEYDELFSEKKNKTQALREKIQQGDKKTIREVTGDVVRQLKTFNPGSSAKSYVANKDQVHNDAVRAHLQEAHRSTGGDAKVLGLDNPAPDLKELKIAYRNASMKAHPDRGGSTDDFQRVNGAYERLLEKYHPDALRKSLYSFNSVLYRMDEESRSLIKCVHQFKGWETAYA